MITGNLSKQEKKYLAAGGTAILVFLVFQFFYVPVMAKKENLARLLEIRTTSLTEMHRLRQEHDQISRRFDSRTDIIRSRDQGFSLFSFLDQQARAAGIRQKVAYMQPFSQESDQSDYSAVNVKLKLNDLYLKELVAFLSMVESEKNGVQVTFLSLGRTGPGQDLLEAVIETRTLISKEIPIDINGRMDRPGIEP